MAYSEHEARFICEKAKAAAQAMHALLILVPSKDESKAAESLLDTVGEFSGYHGFGVPGAVARELYEAEFWSAFKPKEKAHQTRAYDAWMAFERSYMREPSYA